MGRKVRIGKIYFMGEGKFFLKVGEGPADG
jgi:hypothetical protein